MTLQFFIFTIHISRREKSISNKNRKYIRTPEEEWFDRKMMYLSRM
ncbi:YrzI family small protein [Thalassobacillus pellis]|nr:YrzI family small protein [Thalassobacillus pellis]MBM7552996.1 hypothetical protein [Thalassobacillus pellis]